MRNLNPPYNTWFLGLTEVLNPNGIAIGSGVFCRAYDRVSQTNRHTDNATLSLTIGYYLHIGYSMVYS